MPAVQSATLDVQHFIDERPVSPFQWLTLALCFLVAFLDGFDTAAVGFVAPALSKAWQLPPPDLKQLLTVGFFGLAVGALVAGPLADRVGRKWVLIAALAFFGVFSLVSAVATGLTELTVLRFLTGIGLGAAMPNATTLTAEYCPARRRSLLITLMFSGFTLGSAGGGFVAAAMIPHFGWPSVFVTGGVAPLLLALVLAVALPESIQYLVARGTGRRDAIATIVRRIDPSLRIGDNTRFVNGGARTSERPSLGVLFDNGLGFGTIAVWVTFFMGLIVIYLLTSWLPTLITSAGLPIEQAVVIGAMFQLGGTIGALVVSWCMDRTNAHVSIAVSYLLGAVMLVVIAQVSANLVVLSAAVFMAGFFMSGSQTSMSPLAAGFYPTVGRATGVSWMLGIGRFGAILGAFMGGILLSLGWGFQLIIGVLAVPATIAALAVLLKMRHYHASISAEPVLRAAD
ncbi:aromatic acid/H+ symport family MFS transporter [Bradyrhizobium prioriisuperbiae]|uniref:MFS transporter n=1 Tax=Bradyrhizobium prioriisuperbiae TaxID=2854389 RepID=UPI0028E38FCB|nr:aromatic acid/H+ symport family MFS transporter [Bradyrhizobium prioritasuperba]